MAVPKFATQDYDNICYFYDEHGLPQRRIRKPLQPQGNCKDYFDEGMRYFRQKKLKLAISLFEKASKEDPTHVKSKVYCSKCRLILGYFNDAMQDVEAVLAENPENTFAIQQKADILFYMGKFEDAVKLYSRGYHQHPNMRGFKVGMLTGKEAINNSIGELKIYNMQ